MCLTHGALASEASIPAHHESPDRCVGSAAQFHRVNPDILKAILKVESDLNPLAVNRNSNGSEDIGIAGTNSRHLAELGKHGISRNHLFDACVSTYVAAWNLSKAMSRFGNTWYGVAAYHSSTPYYNERYQVLLQNALVRMKVLSGPIKRVPPLRPATGSKQAPTSEDGRSELFAVSR